MVKIARCAIYLAVISFISQVSLAMQVEPFGQTDEPPRFERSKKDFRQAVALWKVQAIRQNVLNDSELEKLSQRALTGNFEATNKLTKALQYTELVPEQTTKLSAKVFDIISHNIQNTWSEDVLIRFFEDKELFNQGLCAHVLEPNPDRYVMLGKVLDRTYGQGQGRTKSIIHDCFAWGYHALKSAITTPQARESLYTLLEFYHVNPKIAYESKLTPYAQKFLKSDDPIESFDLTQKLYQADVQKVVDPLLIAARKQRKKEGKKAQKAKMKQVVQQAEGSMATISNDHIQEMSVETESSCLAAYVMSEALMQKRADFELNCSSEKMVAFIDAAIEEAAHGDTAAQQVLIQLRDNGLSGIKLFARDHAKVKRAIHRLGIEPKKNLAKSSDLREKMLAAYADKRFEELGSFELEAESQSDYQTLMLLAKLHVEGDGVSQSDEKAYRCFHKATMTDMFEKSSEYQQSYYIDEILLPLFRHNYPAASYKMLALVLKQLNGGQTQLAKVRKSVHVLLEQIDSFEKKVSLSLCNPILLYQDTGLLATIRHMPMSPDKELICMKLGIWAASRIEHIFQKTFLDVAALKVPLDMLALVEEFIHRYMTIAIASGKGLNATKIKREEVKKLTSILNRVQVYPSFKDIMLEYAPQLKLLLRLNPTLSILQEDTTPQDKRTCIQLLAQMKGIDGFAHNYLNRMQLLEKVDIDDILHHLSDNENQFEVLKYYYDADHFYNQLSWDQGVELTYTFSCTAHKLMTADEYYDLCHTIDLEAHFKRIREFFSEYKNDSNYMQRYVYETVLRIAHFARLAKANKATAEERASYIKCIDDTIEYLCRHDKEAFIECELIGHFLMDTIAPPDFVRVRNLMVDALKKSSIHVCSSEHIQVVEDTYRKVMTFLSVSDDPAHQSIKKILEWAHDRYKPQQKIHDKELL